MRKFLKLGLLASLVLGSVSAPASAADFKVDPAHSQLVVQVFKDGVAARLAHDHVVAATQSSGKVSFDPAAGTGMISMEVKTNTLKADDPALRKKYGLPEGPNAKDSAEIEANMKSEGQLNTAKYPTISFQSTAITRSADGRYNVTGNLTLRGKTRQVSFPATAEMQGSNFHGKGQLKLNQTDFGYEPYSALFGAIKNKNEVILNLDIIATP